RPRRPRRPGRRRQSPDLGQTQGEMRRSAAREHGESRARVHVSFMRASLRSGATRKTGAGTMWRALRLIIVILAAAAVPVEAGEPGCVDWGKAAAIIAPNGLLP